MEEYPIDDKGTKAKIMVAMKVPYAAAPLSALRFMVGRKSSVESGIALVKLIAFAILKKVSFDIFRIILVSKEEKNFRIESKDKGLSLSKFS